MYKKRVYLRKIAITFLFFVFSKNFQYKPCSGAYSLSIDKKNILQVSRIEKSTRYSLNRSFHLYIYPNWVKCMIVLTPWGKFIISADFAGYSKTKFLEDLRCSQWQNCSER